MARRSLFLMSLTMTLTAPPGFSSQERPYLRYEGDAESLRKSLEPLLARPLNDLAPQLVPGDRAAKANDRALRSADSLIALANITGERCWADRALLVLKTISDPYLDAPEQQILSQITERGALDKSNLLMRDVAYDLARIYHLSGDAVAAKRCAEILSRLADVMPKWPLVTREGETRHQDDAAYRGAWDANGLWGVWFWLDLRAGLPVVRAFDLIHNSGAMQRLGALEKIERNLLRYQVEHFLERPVSLSNLLDHVLQAIPIYGIAIPEPKYVHLAVQRYRWVIQSQYYADGFWHEGAPGYHKDITWGLTRKVPALLKGYSDPPGYTCDIDRPRYNSLDLETEYARQHTRMWDVLKKLTFPNKDYAKLHDATYPHGAWWDVRPTRSCPRIVGCMGHAILGTRSDPDQAQLHLHYSGTHGHEHYDALNIILFAHGREHISETHYRTRGVSPREWHTMTAGHNTVVIDEQNQLGRFPPPSHRRPITDADAMDDIPNWRYRAGGHGNALNDPKLRCFCPDWDAVQVAEAEAERAYCPDPDLYRRTVALVHVDERNVYAVDIFRVRGGQRHDWMLHGCLQLPYELSTSLKLSPMDGTIHKYLDQLRSTTTDAGLTATFTYEKGSHLRTHVLGQPGTQVIVGRGPAMRRDGYAHFLDLRRDESESCFVAVHDPYDEKPNVEAIEPIAWGDDPMNVGVRVRLANGCSDIIVSSPEEPSFKEHDVGTGIVFAGRLAHVRFRDQNLVHAYGVDARRLKVGGIDLDGPGHYEGEITRTHRVEAGAKFDAFETSGQLPAGLEGRCLVVDLGGVLTQAFIIERVEPTETGALIYSKDEPGIEIRGDLIKMMYYPGWGIPRPCRFRISETLKWTAAGE